MKEAREVHEYEEIKQKADVVLDKKREEDAIWDPEIGMSDFKIHFDSKSNTNSKTKA